MNIMSLDAAYGVGTIREMISEDVDETAGGGEEGASGGLERTARVSGKVNTKIKPMELLSDAELNIPLAMRQPQQTNGFSSFGPPAMQQAPPPPPPLLPHPSQFLQAVVPPADEHFEAQLQQNLAEQHAAQLPAAAAAMTPLRGGNARFAKYDGDGVAVIVDSNNANVRPTPSSFTSSVSSFYERNKIGILVVIILFFLFIGVLIAVLVKSAASKRARANVSMTGGGGGGPDVAARHQAPFSTLGGGDGDGTAAFVCDLDWADSASQPPRRMRAPLLPS